MALGYGVHGTGLKVRGFEVEGLGLSDKDDHDDEDGDIVVYGLFSKVCAPCGYRIRYGTSYLGVPKWDPSFGNYP